ncbi:MAG: UPF0149 family protein [Burkholderiales bacterium]|nr:UPF0149 family protein [Burkholderiales bacterium]
MQLDQPLSDKEFNELDQFLLSERCPEDAMTMDCLHGFLSAIAMGPEEFTLAQWLPHVWGGEQGEAPKFKNNKESERIISLIVRFMHEILITLEVAPKEYEPLFVEHDVDGKSLIDGEAWCSGFWEGMHLIEDSWKEIWESNLEPLMRPIYLLGSDELEEEEAEMLEDPKQRHKLSIEVEANLPQIHKFWLPRKKSLVQTVVRETPKAGRNDPCPCGSGEKFKKCCGANAATDKADAE